MSTIYNSYFFNDFYAKNGGGNYTKKEQWMPFFNMIASQIIERFHPQTVLDAGCALGYLVEAFRDQGVEAYGFDISDYAIGQTREDIRRYCIVHSIEDSLPSNFPQHFDLVITIEVLEHLFPENGKLAIKNLCQYSDKIIFSSTPDDITDRTHVNVQLGEYWAKIFAENSFYRNLVQPMDFICPWAKLFEKKSNIPNVIYDYEMNTRIDGINADNGKEIIGTLYFDDGAGFGENNCIKVKRSSNSNDFKQRFDIPKGIHMLRLDPIESKACVLENIGIISNCGALEIEALNGKEFDNFIIFDNTDPQILIDIQGKTVQWIEIEFTILAFDDMASIMMLSKFSELPDLKRDLIEKSREDLANKELIQKKNDFINKLQEELENNKIQLLNIKSDQDDFLKCQQEIEQLKSMYNTISNSTFWRITKPFRLTLDLLKSFYHLKRSERLDSEVKKSIDCFKFNSNVLTVNGWLFSPVLKIEDLHIKIVYKKQEYRVELFSSLERSDVEEKFQNENARYSGFTSMTSVENCNKFRVYLEFLCGGKSEVLLVGTIHSPFYARLSYYRQKLNRQNLHKLVSYIRNKRYDLVSAAIKRPRIHTMNSSEMPSVDLHEWIEENLTDTLLYPQELYQYTIDLIVPVYNGYQYFERLFDTVRNTKMQYRLFIVNDNSTDVRVEPYLAELAAHDDRVILLKNDINMGFVQSVNKALAKTINHVVLLNTDIELPNQWLERLMTPIILNEKVASSTPFTNSGTLCSFPTIGQDNKIFKNMSCAEVDNGFQCIKPSYTEIPTGVGFCMGMNKFVLKEIGLLDAETFSKGYGEENDWCQRAIKSGYKNVMVENLFVYHKHGGSFLSEDKQRLIERNGRLLSKKHPNYNIDVAKFFELDPVKHVRNFVIMKLTADLKDKKPLVAFDHNLGGGATSYLDNLKRKKINDGEKMIIIRYDANRHVFLLSYFYEKFNISYRFKRFNDLNKIIKIVGIQTIYVNELVTYPNLYKTLEQIIAMKEKFGAKLIMLLHDYFAICPTINLLDTKNCYCDLPDLGDCESCIRNNLFNNYPKYESMKKWREEWGAFLCACDEVIAFSNSSGELLRKIYGEVRSLSVIPHKVNYVPRLNKTHKMTKSLNIGLMGILNNHKGIEIIHHMLKQIEDENLNVRIILIGSSEGAVHHSSFYETGRYSQESLPRLTLQNDIDLFFISSICPETFSYTTEEAMKMGLPVTVFNLGAPAERVKYYEKGLIISKIDARTALDEIILFSERKGIIASPQMKHPKVLFIAGYISFSSRYRVEHFREQLLIQGIQSDFTEPKYLERYDPEKFDAIVIYRCTDTNKLISFINRAHSCGRKVFYDIDDYIFNYEEIRDLPFLTGDDYIDFESYSRKIHGCMTLCDAFLTSTENMKKAIEKTFPGKLVCVNRNVASMEMVSLSLKAKDMAVHDEDKVILGYFSGSKTHDGDFAIIGEVLLKLMDHYDNLYLMTGGSLKLDEKFQMYNSRLIHFDFVDWRKLPELISSIDINLMPLEDTFFHACKSENKWMEAALVGVSTVASYNNELDKCIENGVTGFLCHNEAEWKNTLSQIIKDKPMRNSIAQRANEKVLKYNISINTGGLASKFIMGE